MFQRPRLTPSLHPTDKVAPSHRKTAHTKFQEIAFAYAILSDTARRDRYDTTGSTSESLSDDFNWASYFKAQYADTVTVDKLNSLKTTYQGSEEEKRDVLDAYKRYKGNLNKVFRDVMMSNALEDEDRFREYIDAAITAEEVQGFDAYVNEAKKIRKARKKGAEREKTEATEHAKELGVYESLFENGKPKDGGQKGLADLIQQRQKQRATTFLDDLETKYGGKSAVNGKPNGKKRKANDEPLAEVSKMNGTGHKRRKAAEVIDESSGEDEQDEASDEPPEEAFQAMAARTQKASYVKPAAEDSDAEESLGDEDTEEEEDEQEEEEAPKEEKPKPAKKATRQRQVQRRRANTKRPSGGRK
jgi:DnaJ family protein C protein 9